MSRERRTTIDEIEPILVPDQNLACTRSASLVVEERMGLARRVLCDSTVPWISEGRNKLVQHNDALAADLGLRIDSDRLLPDTILADLALPEPSVVFVEGVATDGPMTAVRREKHLVVLTDACFDPAQAGKPQGLYRSEQLR